jgi:hypothetical protein
LAGVLKNPRADGRRDGRFTGDGGTHGTGTSRSGRCNNFCDVLGSNEADGGEEEDLGKHLDY